MPATAGLLLRHRSVLPRIRAYLKLYTNIDMPKLAEFCGVPVEETQ
jgi:hypothetical protein